MQKPPHTHFFRPLAADQRQRVGLLLVPSFSHMTLAGIMDPLRAANRQAGRALYETCLISTDGKPVRSTSGFEIAVDASLGERLELDQLFVVSSYEVDKFCKPAVLRDLRRIAASGLPIGGMESGVFVLARAGLLDGYRATAHWEDLDHFATEFPRVATVGDRYVVDRNRASTSGAIPTLDFAIHLLRQQQGFALALEVASTFIYEQESSPRDAQRMLSLGRLKWAEPHLAAAIDLMEQNLEQPLSLIKLASRIGVSERTLQRDFHRVMGTSPARFYQWIRLNAARRLLLQTDLPMTDVAAACGFEDRSAFSRAFRTRFDSAPSVLRGEDRKPPSGSVRRG